MRRFPTHYNKLIGRKLILTKIVAEIVTEGCTVSMNGKTYKAGDTVPEHEV